MRAFFYGVDCTKKAPQPGGGLWGNRFCLLLGGEHEETCSAVLLLIDYQISQVCQAEILIFFGSAFLVVRMVGGYIVKIFVVARDWLDCIMSASASRIRYTFGLLLIWKHRNNFLLAEQQTLKLLRGMILYSLELSRIAETYDNEEDKINAYADVLAGVRDETQQNMNFNKERSDL